MTERSFNDPFLAALAPRLGALEPRTRAAIAGLPPEALAAAPPGGGWSIAEVFEHLCVASASYDAALADALATARARFGNPRRHRRTFLGGLLLRSLAESNLKKLPAPRVYRPLTPRPNVVEAFVASLRNLERWMSEADGLDLRVMLSSPVLPIIRMNLGDALELGIVHAERHLAQVERTPRALGV